MTNLALKLLNMHEERTSDSTTQNPLLNSTPDCMSLFQLNQYAIGTYNLTKKEQVHMTSCVYCSARSQAMTQMLKDEGYLSSQNAKGGQK